MKQSVLRAFALCLTTALAAGYAYAKDDTDGSKSSQTKQSTQSSQSTSSSSQGAPGSTSGAYSSTTSSHMTGKSARLSKLMHTSIKGQSGENLGQVQDLIVDPDSGQIQFVVLSPTGASAGAPGSSTSTTSGVGTSSRTGTAGTPGIGTPGSLTSGQLVAVPWSLVTQSGADQFTINVDRTKLMSAPTFSATAWPTMDSSWSQRVYSHFGVDANSATGAPGSSSGRSIGTPAPGTSTQPTPGLPTTPGTPDLNSPSSGTGAPGASSGTRSSGTRSSGTGSSGSSGSSGSGGK